MPLLPLWSGIILCTVNSSENATDSNAINENWFRIVKHNLLNSETEYELLIFITVYIDQGGPTCGPRYTSVWPAEPQDENE